MNCTLHCLGQIAASLGVTLGWLTACVVAALAIGVFLAFELKRAPLLNEADDLTEASDPYTTALLKNNFHGASNNQGGQ